MEQQVRAKCEQLLNQAANTSDVPTSLQALSLARSLIVNPSTSEATISSLFEALSLSLHPDRDPLSLHHTLSLLSDLADRRPHLSLPVFHTIRSFSLLCNHGSPRTLAATLSVLVSIADSDQTLTSSIAEFSEGLFLTLCFRSSVAVRHWMLLNAERFKVRPHLLLTVFLGFTKDPYPYVRRVALDGLVGLCKSIVVEDRALVESCYCRAVELFSDMEDCVRFAAVRAVSQWGKLLLALNHESDKGDRSDALFVQLCSMVRDMNVKVRVEAFDALGEIAMVSENILLQTLSKKLLSVIKEKTYPGMCSANPVEIPASSAAGVFVHGLEDEFCEVRKSACHSLHMLSILSADFAGEALTLLMDVLNDNSTIVRLQALETMRCMALFDRLKLQETHMHMFLGTLVDTSAVVRSASRKVLRIMKLNDMAMFKLSVDGLLENLEMYPQDEADVFSVLFNMGQNHGNFAVDTIMGVSDEIEPSSDGKVGFGSPRVAALLVLAISAPLSHEQRSSSIPPRIFSYAVTMLGRISHALSNVMDQDTLLAYLSHCSVSAVFCAAEFHFKKDDSFFPIEDGLPNDANGEIFIPAKLQLQQLNDGACGIHSQEEDNKETMTFMEVILDNIKYIWQLIKFGSTDEVLKTLRSWKEELETSSTGSSDDALAFMLQYFSIMKLLAKIWPYLISPRKHCTYRIGELGLLLEKLDRALRKMRYRFIGLDKPVELHILELILLNYVLRLSSVEAYCDGTTLGKLHFALSRIEFLLKEASIEPSIFVTELKKSLHEIGFSTKGSFNSPFLFRKLIENFSLKPLVLGVKLKHLKAELDVNDNDFDNPFHFIPGLPVGIQLEITLYNISTENRLWLQLTTAEDLTEFVFLDLNRFGGDNQIRKFTFVAPFCKTPKAKSFTLKVYLGMECLSDHVHLSKCCRGPKQGLVYMCQEKEVFLSMDLKREW